MTEEKRPRRRVCRVREAGSDAQRRRLAAVAAADRAVSACHTTPADPVTHSLPSPSPLPPHCRILTHVHTPAIVVVVTIDALCTPSVWVREMPNSSAACFKGNVALMPRASCRSLSLSIACHGFTGIRDHRQSPPTPNHWYPYFAIPSLFLVPLQHVADDLACKSNQVLDPNCLSSLSFEICDSQKKEKRMRRLSDPGTLMRQRIAALTCLYERACVLHKRIRLLLLLLLLLVVQEVQRERRKDDPA